MVGYNNNYTPMTSGGFHFVSGFNNTAVATAAGPAWVFGPGNSLEDDVSPGQKFIIGTDNHIGATGIYIGGGITSTFRATVINNNPAGPGVSPTATDQFIIQGVAGVDIYSDYSGAAGVSLANGGGSWASISDRHKKENIKEISYQDILNKISKLEVTEWSYLAQKPSTKNKYTVSPLHIGPMAQDFSAIFGYGEYTDKITSSDIDGVMFAAIKALKEKTDEIETLKKEIAEIKLLLKKQ